MGRLGAAVLVFVSYAGILFYQAGQTRIGSGLIDPVGAIGAQDEAVYSAAAIGMSRSGDWLTPRFLGRPFLYKPPLLYWASAASVSVLGESAAAVRLPSILASAGVCALAFWWVWGAAGIWPAILALALVAGNPFWFSMGQRNMADALLAAFLVVAVWLLWKHGSQVGSAFALLVAAGILVKSVAGLLPVIIYAAVWALEPKTQRASAWHVAKLAALTAAITAPWFAYQLAVNPRWFWEEFVKIELLAWGLGSPPQTSSEPAIVFYGRRLFGMDPVLCLAAALSVYWAMRNKLEGRKAVLLLWLAVCCLALFAYSYRNATYLLPLIPALAIAAAMHTPRKLAMALALAVSVKIAFFWPQTADPHPVFQTMESYCSERRVNETVVVSAGDQFYSTLLPSSNVRYAFAESEFPPEGFAVDFRAMGIVVTVDEFLNLEPKIAGYKKRLEYWGVKSSEPIATVVLFKDQAELERLMRERSDADFIHAHTSSVPIRYGPSLDETLTDSPCRM